MKRIAILGATSHIAKNLILAFDQFRDYEMSLFARHSDRVVRFLKERQCRNHGIFQDFSRLYDERYDVVINCILNFGGKAIHGVSDYELFEVAEFFDNLVIAYLRRNERCLYINFSSGAVYGGDFEKPVQWEQRAVLPINRITESEYYQAVKLYSEVKHRALPSLNIVDIRVFSFFSRFLSLGSRFFMTEIVNSLLENRVFETNDIEIVRDYAHPDDLFRLMVDCIQYERINTAFDLFSRAPIGKFELLKLFEREFGLKYRLVEKTIEKSTTGIKRVYCSDNRTAGSIGFVPQFTAKETLVSETRAFLVSSKGD